MNANPETQHKVLILGNQEVGKTAIVNSVSFFIARTYPDPATLKPKLSMTLGTSVGPRGQTKPSI